MFAITSYVSVYPSGCCCCCLLLLFPLSYHKAIQYHVWPTVRYGDRAVPSAPLAMYAACVILITVVTATHCGINFGELLQRHADMNIWKLRQSCIPIGNYPNSSTDTHMIS